jgi:hypothetical protein
MTDRTVEKNLTSSKNRLICALVLLGLSAQTAAAQEIVCLNSKEGPGDLEEWRIVCNSTEHIFADVRFRPIDWDKGEMELHITEHEVCEDNKRIVCELSNSGSTGCFYEGNIPWTEYDGYVTGANIVCACYAEGEEPCS